MVAAGPRRRVADGHSRGDHRADAALHAHWPPHHRRRLQRTDRAALRRARRTCEIDRLYPRRSIRRTRRNSRILLHLQRQSDHPQRRRAGRDRRGFYRGREHLRRPRLNFRQPDRRAHDEHGRQRLYETRLAQLGAGNRHRSDYHHRGGTGSTAAPKLVVQVFNLHVRTESLHYNESTMPTRPIVLVTEGSDKAPLDWLRTQAEVLEVGLNDPALDQALSRADGMVVRTYTKV